MHIVAASIIRNADRYLPTMIKSISWVDEIIIYDDHSDSKSKEFLKEIVDKSSIKISLLGELSKSPMMNINYDGSRNIDNEMLVRNKFITKIFGEFELDALVLIDADELITDQLRPIIEEKLSDNKFDSIAFTCNHLVDKNSYMHFYETTWNGVFMVDPHVRVLKKMRLYQRGEYPGVPDCFLKPNKKTLCLDGPYHYHLKYLKKLDEVNQSLKFLPMKRSNKYKRFVRRNRFKVPLDVVEAINSVR